MAINPGALLNSVPSPVKQTTTDSYLDFSTGWAQQYLPDLVAAEAEVFGNRSVSGMLAQVGAEEAMSADQVVWSEQGRLHLSYNADQDASTDGLFTIDADADGLATTGIVRVGDTVIVSTADRTIKAYCAGSFNDGTAGLTAGQIQLHPYEASTFVVAGIPLNTPDCKLFVYGSEYGKGASGRGAAVEPSFKSFNNKPIILKDLYEVSGSDASQIGWVEVTGEDGQNGYLWYLKAEGDTRTRFNDYLEMSAVEAVKKNGGNAVVPEGSEGLFAAITSRGNITTGMNGTVAATLTDFDAILAEFDKQGAIEENMMYLSRESSLAIDDMLAALDGGNTGAGSAYGVFDNSMDMALNLGFTGFRRGSYDFYKTDWKYLNDKTTRGSVIDAATGSTTNGLGAVNGVIIPAGVSSVYDQTLGRNLKRPFLHVRYRASQTESRKLKSWVTGSVGAVTSDLDAMQVHYLSERCLVTQGANNFMLIKG
jgi:hypothetical protein